MIHKPNMVQNDLTSESFLKGLSELPRHHPAGADVWLEIEIAHSFGHLSLETVLKSAFFLRYNDRLLKL